MFAPAATSWSQFDYKLMLGQLDYHPAERKLLLKCYRNAIDTSRRWHSKEYPKQKWRNDLSTVAKLLNFKIPEKYGVGLVTNSLSRQSRNQTGNTRPRLCADLSDVQPIYVPAIVLEQVERVKTTHWV